MLDASPANVLRIPFLHAAFPAATFLYVYREPRRTIHELPVGGDLSVEELGRRWNGATSQLLDDLERLPPRQWMVIAYRMLIDQPASVAARVAEFIDIRCEATLPPPQSSPQPLPSPEIVAELDRIDEITRDVAARATDFFAVPPPRSAPTREKAMQMKTEAEAAPFRSVATQSFAGLLEHLGISLVVSTYQSGRLILLRADNATTINTHFRMFRSPMGIAVGNGRLAVGTEREVWDYRDQPAVAVMHLDTWNSLPADVQALIAADVKAESAWGRKQVRKIGPGLIANFGAAGIAVHTPSQDELRAFAAATLPTHKKFTDKYGSAFYKSITKHI